MEQTRLLYKLHTKCWKIPFKTPEVRVEIYFCTDSNSVKPACQNSNISRVARSGGFKRKAELKQDFF